MEHQFNWIELTEQDESEECWEKGFYCQECVLLFCESVSASESESDDNEQEDDEDESL